jgi:hypothetical protein
MITKINRQRNRIVHSNRGLRRPYTYLSMLILLLALLAGCSGSSDAPTAPPTDSAGSGVSENTPLPTQGSESTFPALVAGTDVLAAFDPCEMLTQEEVEGFFEGPMSPDASPESIGPYRSCMFTSQAGGKMIIVQVTRENAEQFKADNEGSAAMFEIVPTPVAGLGDEAVFMSGLLRVRVGDMVFQAVTWHPEDQQDQAFTMTQEIARLALKRMP